MLITNLFNSIAQYLNPYKKKNYVVTLNPNFNCHNKSFQMIIIACYSQESLDLFRQMPINQCFNNNSYNHILVKSETIKKCILYVTPNEMVPQQYMSILMKNQFNQPLKGIIAIANLPNSEQVKCELDINETKAIIECNKNGIFYLPQNK